jgi:hypothetical protein
VFVHAVNESAQRTDGLTGTDDRCSTGRTRRGIVIGLAAEEFCASFLGRQCCQSFSDVRRNHRKGHTLMDDHSMSAGFLV